MENVRLIADRYAQALSSTVESTEELSALRDELLRVAAVVRESPELGHVLENPVIDGDEKIAVMVEIARRLETSQLTQRFLRVVGQHGRLVILDAIARAVSEAYDERAGIHEVRIRSAVPLEDALKERLAAVLEKVAGGTIRIEETVDPSLMGGLVARVGTQVFDGSLKTRLSEMRSRLARGGATGRVAG
jgi:F-type H+-transporting ATPase subunit delta